MTLWRPPVPSQLPLAPVWRALGRVNYGGDLTCDQDGIWTVVCDRLTKRQGEWYKERVLATVVGDDWTAVLSLPRPTLGVRLALIGMYLDVATAG